MRHTPVTLSLIAFALTLSVHGSAPANFIINGGFESPVVPAGRYNTYGPAGGLTGWTVTAGDVDVNAANPFGSPFEGAQWLDLDGNVAGTIAQTFATAPGTTYTLTFEYGNNTALSGASGRVEVTGAGSSLLLYADFTHVGSSVTDMNYQKYTGTFTADSTAATLIFQSTFDGPTGIALDAVSVDAVTPVPAPGGLHLFAVGCAGLIGYGCRRSPR